MRTYGIDTSSNNSGLNMSSAKRGGAKFCFVKTTEGTGYVNPLASAQVHEAKRQGMSVYGYHFSLFGASIAGAKAEATFAVKKAKSLGIPKGAYFACDWETGDGNNIYGGYNASANAIVTFMKIVKESGYRPLLYSGASCIKNNLNRSIVLAHFPNSLWVASYPTMGRYDSIQSIVNWKPNINGMLIWQFTVNFCGLNVDGNVVIGKLAKGSSSGGDIEMTWHVKVSPDDAGGFMVTKKAGATLWAGANNKKKASSRMLPYASNWRVAREKDGFYEVGKNQWIDGRTGVFKANPLKYQSIHAVVEVTGAAAGHAEAGGPVTGRDFKKGEKFKVHGKQGEYLLVGTGKDKWLHATKCKVIL